MFSYFSVSMPPFSSAVRCFVVFTNGRNMKVIFQISIFFILLVFGASPTYSCDCDCQSKSSTRAKFRNADFVFVGEVTKFDFPFKVETIEDVRFFSYQATFKVEKQWKGRKHSEITALVSGNLSGCQSDEMRVGERFLIFASQESGQFFVRRDFCSSSKKAECAKDEIKKLKNFFYRTSISIYPFSTF